MNQSFSNQFDQKETLENVEITNVDGEPTATLEPGASLALALEKIGDGTLILKNGEYALDETFEISGSPTIRSESGNPGDVAIYSASAIPLKISGSPTFRGVTIRCDAPKKRPGGPYIESWAVWSVAKAALWIVGGAATFVDCAIRSADYIGVYARNALARPRFKDCKIEPCGENALALAFDCAPEFDGCEFEGGPRDASVFVVWGSAPKFIKCKVYGGEWGIVSDRSFGEFVDGEIFNCRVGVDLNGSGDMKFRNSKIYKAQVGVDSNEFGLGEFVDCEIFDCAKDCVVAWRNSKPKLRRCKIYNGDCGVLAKSGGFCELHDCEIFDCATVGIRVWAGGSPTATNCRIRDVGVGVRVARRGSGTFVKNVLSGCAKKVWNVDKDAEEVVRIDNVPNEQPAKRR